jgi:trans-aconitate methyltransferase
MGAASHLGIDLRRYDRLIRTFIPGYEEMLKLAANALTAAVPTRTPVIVDLGIGTGALSAECVRARPRATILGIDEDAAMLEMARRRLGRRASVLTGSFERVDLPPCDVIVASLALHHVPTAARRAKLFRRCVRALRAGGALIIADCYLSSAAAMQAADRREWLRHLERTYTASQARGYLRAWAKEDFYVELAEEIRLLTRAGFTVDIAGRHGCFAVIAGQPSIDGEARPPN